MFDDLEPKKSRDAAPVTPAAAPGNYAAMFDNLANPAAQEDEAAKQARIESRVLRAFGPVPRKDVGGQPLPLGKVKDASGASLYETPENRDKALEDLMAIAVPIPVTQRFLAKIKTTEHGVEGFLRTTYPNAQVQAIGGNNWAVFRPGMKPMLLEEAGTATTAGWLREKAKDVLDFAPEIVEGVASSLGAVAGMAIGAGAGTVAAPVAPGASTVAGAITGAATGAAAGRTGRHAVSAMLPGEDYPGTAGDKAAAVVKDIGASALAGAVGEGLGQGAGAVLRTPGNLAQKYVQGIEITGKGGAKTSAREAYAQGRWAEMAATPDEMPAMPDSRPLLTIGEHTGSPEIVAAEKTIAQTPGGQGPMAAQAADSTRTVADWIRRKTAEELGSSPGSEAAGEQVALKYHANQARFVDARRAQAATDFAAVPKGVVVPSKPVTDELDALVAARPTEGGTGPANALVKALKQARKEIPEDGMSVDMLRARLADWGDKAKSGVATIVPDMSPSESQRIAGQVFGAYKKALDMAADQPAGVPVRGPNGQMASMKASTPAAQALRTARDNYREASKAIDESKDVALESLMRKMTGEKRMPRTLDPADLQNTSSVVKWVDAADGKDVSRTLGAIQSIDPATADRVRSAWLGGVLEKAAPPVDSELGRQGIAFTPGGFAGVVKNEGDKLEAVLGKNSKLLFNLRSAAAIMEKKAQSAGMKGSQTAPLASRMAAVKLVISPRWVTAPVEQLTQLAEIFAQRKLANVLTDQAASDAFMGLIAPPPAATPRHMAAWLATVVAAANRDDNNPEDQNP